MKISPDDRNVLYLGKGRERYIFIFDDAHRAECLRTLGRFATSENLSFSWFDAAVLSQQIRVASEKVKVAAENRKARF